MSSGRTGLHVVIPPWVGLLVAAVLLALELLVPADRIGPVGWVGNALALSGAVLVTRWPYAGAGLTLVALTVLLLIPDALVMGVRFTSLWVAVALVTQKESFPPLVVVLAFWAVAVLLAVFAEPDASLVQMVSHAVGLGVLYFGAGFLGSLLRRYQAVAQGVVRGLEKERELFRRALSRDLHDSAVHTMTSMVMRANEALLRENLDARAREDLQFISDAGREGVDDLRRMLASLRRADVLPAASKVDARWFENRLRVESSRLERSGFRVKLPDEVPSSDVTSPVLAVMGRILVEAANNVMRHGQPGSEVVIMLENDGERFSMMCTNLVKPSDDTSERKRLGIVGMRELAETFGGTVSAQALGPRWVTHVEIPCAGTVTDPEAVESDVNAEVREGEEE